LLPLLLPLLLLLLPKVVHTAELSADSRDMAQKAIRTDGFRRDQAPAAFRT
jgi:hypothetical protein